MGRISSSIGLITGTAINDTVDQLIGISAIPRNRLQARSQQLDQERAALTNLTVLTVGVQLAARGFGNEGIFTRTNVASSDNNAVAAVRTGEPTVGSYNVRTLQTASTHAFNSKTFASGARAIGNAGSLTIRGGGYVDRSLGLDQLNGGRGVESGSIRITDRSGQSTVIDLSTAATIDDVLSAINESAGINVRATTDGDAIRLEDRTGASDSNLIIEEVGGGSTAADLGLRGINTSNNTATGADILRLSAALSLSELRDGRGLGFGDGDDLKISLRDGSEFTVDFADFSREEAQATGATQNVDANAGLTFSAVESGAVGDGVKIRFVDDPTIIQGQETVEKLETDTGTELVFRIQAGATTATDIVEALAANEELAEEFTAVASGDGSGTVATADVATLTGGAAIEAVSNPSIGDVLRVLNDLDPTKFRAELAPGADRLRFVDLTSGSEEFSVEDLGSSTVAADLGVDRSTVDGELTGDRLLSGLATVSLNALAGGKGLGTLGSLDLRTSNGSTAAVDLSAAETLQDVINAINDSGLQIEAAIGGDGAGLQLRDLSGGSAALFKVSSSDDTAALLGIAAETADTVIDGKGLELQFVARGTRLSQLNQGRGTDDRSFRITDSLGVTKVIDPKGGDVSTVGELIDLINGAGLSVTADINETGDGIRLIDTGNGQGTLKVEDLTGGRTARDLGLQGTARKEVIDGELVSTINGRQADVYTFGSNETLADIAAKIRDTGRFATAALSTEPGGGASLAISSRRGGIAGRIAIGSDGLDLGLRQTSQGRDAIITVGQGENTAGALLRSSDGVFTDAIEGITITAKQVSDSPVRIDVNNDRATLESAIDRFVSQYNTTVSRIDELTFFNADAATTGVLFGRSEIVRIESGLSQLITGRLPRSGSIRSAVDLGLKIGQDGKLEFDKSKFRDALEADPEGVKNFVTREETGFVARIDSLIEQFAGVDGGVLLNRQISINDQIERNNNRISTMNERLERQRQRLLNQFYTMESAISKVQNNQQYLSSISFISLQNSGSR